MNLPVLGPTRWRTSHTHTHIHTHTHTCRVLHLCHSIWTSCSWVQFCAYLYCKNRKMVFYAFFHKIQALSWIYWTDCNEIWYLEECITTEIVRYVSTSLVLVQYNLPHFTSAENVIFISLKNGSYTGRSHFMSWLLSCKTSCESKSWNRENQK